jgi:hypothetical protein
MWPTRYTDVAVRAPDGSPRRPASSRYPSDRDNPCSRLPEGRFADRPSRESLTAAPSRPGPALA